MKVNYTLLIVVFWLRLSFEGRTEDNKLFGTLSVYRVSQRHHKSYGDILPHFLLSWWEQSKHVGEIHGHWPDQKNNAVWRAHCTLGRVEKSKNEIRAFELSSIRALERSSSRARVEAPDPEKKSKSNVEEQLSKCKYKRMISRYFSVPDWNETKIRKNVPLRAPQGL